MNDDIVITIEDCRGAGFCVRGSVNYLDSIGLSYRDLRDGNYTVKQFLAMNDANATIVANRAIRRAEGKNQ